MKFPKCRLVQVRHELVNFISAGKNPAKAGVGKTRVAVEFRLRRFFEHDDFRCARLLSRDRRFKGGAAAAHHYDRDVFGSHGFCFDESSLGCSQTVNWISLLFVYALDVT